jgi:hypothetical protein
MLIFLVGFFRNILNASMRANLEAKYGGIVGKITWDSVEQEGDTIHVTAHATMTKPADNIVFSLEAVDFKERP